MRRIAPLIIVTLALAGCRDNNATKTPSSSEIPSGSASAPAFTRGPALAAASKASDNAGPTAAPKAAPEALDSADASDAPEAPEEEPEALPDVEVKNVGMHIGGEKNTAEQKRPIRATVAERYDDMRRCYAKAADPPRKTTFGVDMRLDGKGGTPKISNPRSGLKGNGVTECLVAVFESIDFPKQPNGVDRMVSFSVEFRRK